MYQVVVFASAVPGNNMQSALVPKTGNIIGVSWKAIVAASGADFSVYLELAFAPTFISTITGADQVISNVLLGADLTTSGAAPTAVNFRDEMVRGIHVQQGERIYLNGSGTAVNVQIFTILQFDFSIGR